MLRIVLASHHNLAKGMKETLEFLTAKENIYAINAYVDESDIDDQILEIFSTFDTQDKVIIFTDMLGGSVNQKFYPKMNDHSFLVCGMNLPLILGCSLMDEETIDANMIEMLVEEAKTQIIFMNTYDLGGNDLEDDE